MKKLTGYVFVVPDRFGDENMDIKKMLKTSAIALVCIAAVVLMILLSGLQNGNSGAAQEDGSGSVMILYTSDIHCGVNEGFGLAGLKAVRSSLENRGYETILVDDGDAIQGNALGMLTGGEAMIRLCQNGDGFTMFDDASNVVNKGKLDSEVLIDYVQKTLGGEIGGDYSDPYGDGRIKISQ